MILFFPIKKLHTLQKSSNFAPPFERWRCILLFNQKQTITMKTKILALVLGTFLAIPCVLRAEETEIQLMEVVGMGTIGGANPLDDPEQFPGEPPRPTDFRALINGNLLSILKQDATIPSAQATVVKASTGSMVLNRQFTNSLSEQIATPGVYVLRISTAGGDLVGQFVVQ